MLDAAVDLPYDLHHLARRVVQGEEEDRRFHHALGLLVESPEQVDEIAYIGEPRGDAGRELELSAAPSLGRIERRRHVRGASANAAGQSRGEYFLDKGRSPECSADLRPKGVRH